MDEPGADVTFTVTVTNTGDTVVTDVLVDDGRPAGLIFICTHNSRRSQLAQVWAGTAARVFGIAGVETFSGGTEVTAFNPRAIAAAERALVSAASEEAKRYFTRALDLGASEPAPRRAKWERGPGMSKQYLDYLRLLNLNVVGIEFDLLAITFEHDLAIAVELLKQLPTICFA